ncbi:MAG: HAD family hydrolase [Clostridia bacterium]|nr:HAD family hydrolase [Clostridia bacterium]
MKTLYITDLDGTFLNSNAVLSDKSKHMLIKAIDNGAFFTVATARTFATVLQMFKDVNINLPLILMNGVMIYDPVKNEIISSHSIKNESIKKVFSVYKKYEILPLVYRQKKNYLEIEYYDTSNPNQMKYVKKRTEASGKRFVYSPVFTDEGKSEVIYIVTLDTYDKLFPLYNELKNISGISCVFYRDNYTDCFFLEIFAESVSKASAMLEVKSITGADRVVVFGDNLNDIEMFKAADEAYAVENACSELKAFATDVIGDNDNDSVAEYILNNCGENR